MMVEVPDHVRSPRGNLWTVLTPFNLRWMALQPMPEDDLPDTASVPQWMTDWRDATAHQMFARGRSRNPAIDAQNDHVGLVRVVRGAARYSFPKLVTTFRPRSEVAQWEPFYSPLAHIVYDIEGEKARVHQMRDTFAVMKWCDDFDDGQRREWFFPLWRWQLALAALGPISFEMMPVTHDATEDDL